MQEQTAPKLAKWPFFLGALVLLSAAGAFLFHSARGPGQGWLMAGCAALAAGLAVVPFLMEYRALVKLLEAQSLAGVLERVREVEGLAVHIAAATSQWQAIQEQAGKTTASAKSIADQMAVEARAFGEFMQKANDTEKATLRLEVEKLHRAQGDWLQVVVRTLDHVYAINQGALRSGDSNLVEQLGNFQAACRDAARRVGLAPFLARPGEPFDPQRHQLAEANLKPAPGAQVGETVATGYNFQGQMIRPALVRLRQPAPVEDADPDEVAEADAGDPSQLSLDTPEGGS